MLASLLPGVRDLRTPLVAGYTLLLVLWLVFHDAIPTAVEATGIAASIYELRDLLGRPAMLAALTFVAYVLGSIVLVREAPFFLLGSHRAREANKAAVKVTRRAALNRKRLGDFVEKIAGPMRGRSGVDGYWDLLPRDINEELHLFGSVDRANVVLWYVGEVVERERDQLATRLQASNQSLYDSYDRLRAEAELRFTLFMPLLALIMVVAAQWSWLTALLVVVPIILALQGWLRQVEAQTVVTQALITGLIASPTLQRIEAWIQTPPKDPYNHRGDADEVGAVGGP